MFAYGSGDDTDTLQGDHKAAEAHAQQHTEDIARNTAATEAFQRLVESSNLTGETDSTEVGTLEAALVEIQTEWWQIRACEMAEQEHHTAAMALMPRRVVAGIQQLNACEAEQVTAQAARGALQQPIPQDADNSGLVDTVMNVVQERLQDIATTEDQEKAIEDRTGQLAIASNIIHDLRASLDFNENEHFFHTMFCSASTLR